MKARGTRDGAWSQSPNGNLSQSSGLASRLARAALCAALLAGALATALGAAASASAETGASAPAPQPSAAGLDPVRQLLDNLHVRTPPVQPPDFVVKSRPPADQLHYVPLNGPRGEPTAPLMTPDQIRAQEADLQALRLRHDRAAGRKSAPLMQTSAAGPPKLPAKKIYTPGCVVTCVIK